MAYEGPFSTISTGDLIPTATINGWGDSIEFLYDNFPQTATIPGWQFIRDDSSFGSPGGNDNQYSQFYLRFQPAVNGYVSTSFNLAAGTYKAWFVGRMVGGSGGTYRWTLDGSTIGVDQDWYKASTTYNVEFNIASVVIATNGRHILKGTAVSKNGSSSDYDLFLSYVIFALADVADLAVGAG